MYVHVITFFLFLRTLPKHSKGRMYFLKLFPIYCIFLDIRLNDCIRMQELGRNLEVARLQYRPIDT